MPTTNDFSTEHLTGAAKTIADAIVVFLTAENDGDAPSGGGCPAFRTPDQHRAKGESDPGTAILLLIHDGGDLAPYCNWSYGHGKGMDRLSALLDNHGFWMEQCTSWYTAVYPKRKK